MVLIALSDLAWNKSTMKKLVDYSVSNLSLEMAKCTENYALTHILQIFSARRK